MSFYDDASFFTRTPVQSQLKLPLQVKLQVVRPGEASADRSFAASLTSIHRTSTLARTNEHVISSFRLCSVIGYIFLP